LAREVQGDSQLAARIRAKYKIKNTVSPAAAIAHKSVSRNLAFFNSLYG
jgi:hypothetical protein